MEISTGDFFCCSDASCWSRLLSIPKSRALSLEALQSRLETMYRGIVLFHGCRPESVDIYLERGLLAGSVQRTDGNLLRLFFGEEPTAQELDAYRHASEEVRWKYDLQENKVFTAVDHRFLVEHAGTYLIYGAERRVDIAVRLPKILSKPELQFIDLLTNIGRPTILQTRQPWAQLGESNTLKIAEKIARTLGKAAGGKRAPLGDLSITVSGSINACDVAVHSFPTRIKDPRKHRIEYRYTDE